MTESHAYQELPGYSIALLPDNATPSIADHRVHNRQATIELFGSESWPLGALNEADRRPATIRFTEWPAGFQSFARHVAYVLINHGNPESLVEQLGSSSVRWPSTGTIRNTLHRLRQQIVWLTTHWSESHPMTPVTQPSDLDQRHLDDLRNWVDQRGTSPRDRAHYLSGIVHIWHLNPWLPEDCQWPEPSWRHGKWKLRRRKEENKTVPLGEAAFDPMLEWAVAFVTNFSPDILAARSHYLERMERLEDTHDGFRKARECLRQYAAASKPLPAKPPGEGNSPPVRIAWHVMAYRHGLPAENFSNSCRRGLKASLKISQELSETALDIPITGRFQGRKWIPFVSVYDVNFTAGRRTASEVGPLIGHLRTACLIVITALTGMRPEEVLNLRVGCAPEPLSRPGGSRVHLIHGLVFKGYSRREDGSPRDARPAAWATIPVATQAVHILEQICHSVGRGDRLLFTEGKSLPIHASTATGWIEYFRQFVNSRLAPHTTSPAAFTIPSDPDGAITLRRFRRTLAWFLRHRPNGSVTTAIQYQHVGLAVGEGYAGTKASGIPDLLLEEDWAHRAATIRHLDLQLSEGKGVGGPAAGRAVEVTRRLPRNLAPSDERRLRKDKFLRIYENPAAIALCVYDEEKAMCRKLEESGKDTRPDLLSCVDSCLNVARTDEHMAVIADQAKQLRAGAEMAPLPMAQSMIARAERNEKIVDSFGSSRISLPDANITAYDRSSEGQE